ncbi:MAG TPA: hypothetical protein VNW30_00325 [Opitutaceae bacterium]|jgi:hypothetical protein|nr:hypothetical protein [Opitutaceae bacterium]
MLSRPPEDLVSKLIPLLSKIVGFSFIVGGAIFLPIGCVLLFLHKENTALIGAVFIGGSIVNIALGFIVLRFIPRFMLGIFRSLRDK